MGSLFLLFTLVPLIEVLLLGKLAGMLGFGATLALVIVTGVLGASLARLEGLRVLRRWQQALAAGQMPESGLTDALLVAVGGVLLVTPGVLTDALGLLLLVPGPRRAIGAAVAARVRARMAEDPGRTFVHFEARTRGEGPFRDVPRGPFADTPFGPPRRAADPRSAPPRAAHPTDPFAEGTAWGGTAPRPQPRRLPQDREVVRVKATVRDVPRDDDDSR